MNGQNYGDRNNPSNFVEKTGTDTTGTAENSDPMTDNVLSNAEMVHETPITRTITNAGHGSEPQAAGIRNLDTPAKEAPVEEIIPVVSRVPDSVPYTAAASSSIDNNWGSKPMPSPAPLVAPIVYEAPVAASPASSTALLNTEDSEHFRTRWNEIQGKFVDEPRTAVQQADVLVADVVQQITRMFTSEHTTLESQWNQGSEVSTEDLRKALQKYRSFFNRLVV